ncbi:MAG: recombinase family protein [Parvularcula sp.]|jgi:hypothetical protein|nr:recombinase family protein [Parvularcula sp.]
MRGAAEACFFRISDLAKGQGAARAPMAASGKPHCSDGHPDERPVWADVREPVGQRTVNDTPAETPLYGENRFSFRWYDDSIIDGVAIVTVYAPMSALGHFRPKDRIMTNTRIGYARCSTDKQDLEAQRTTLLGLGVAEDRIYTDHGLTGTNRERPGLAQALAAVREGDTFVVPKLDRLARSVPDARAIADELEARGVKLALGASVHVPTVPVHSFETANWAYAARCMFVVCSCLMAVGGRWPWRSISHCSL